MTALYWLISVCAALLLGIKLGRKHAHPITKIDLLLAQQSMQRRDRW